jgi:hypothetical protein
MEEVTRGMAFRIMKSRLEWHPEASRPATGDMLVIPSNDHFWMLAGPGLELKKTLGKELELEAVRQGPVEPGALAVTPGEAAGFRLLVHAAVTGQDHQWVAGSGVLAMKACLEQAVRERCATVVVYPLHRGVHGRPEEPTREMLEGLLDGLQAGRGALTVLVLYRDAEEKELLHRTFLHLLSHAGD